MTAQTPTSPANGALSVEVCALPIIAGTRGTLTLVIRNPFDQEIEIYAIVAPSSEPLLPRFRPKDLQVGSRRGLLGKFLLSLGIGSFGAAIRTGPLMADFMDRTGRVFLFEAKGSSKQIVKEPLSPRDSIHVLTEGDAEVRFEPINQAESEVTALRIPPYQEDTTSLELRTAHWLFVTPSVLNLHAVIRYRLGDVSKSQVVPMSITVRPPLLSLMWGSVGGSLFGFAARQFTTNQITIQLLPSIISILGIIVMAIILSIVLSRDSGSKGFVTLEDFYGAFIVGVILGYTGTSYFEGVIGPLSEAQAGNVTVNLR